MSERQQGSGRIEVKKGETLQAAFRRHQGERHCPHCKGDDFHSSVDDEGNVYLTHVMPCPGLPLPPEMRTFLLAFQAVEQHRQECEDCLPGFPCGGYVEIRSSLMDAWALVDEDTLAALDKEQSK